MADIPALSPPRFSHGTRADLRPGDLIESGHPRDSVPQDVTPACVYLTSRLDAAAWEAELTVGDGPGRIYIVEPTGPITIR
jgi:hypothetical protein